ncbi:MAG: TonB-dependent receptor, partial [Tannerella sp.]|nr:TonB-dependent receptor [Tannerella sp.]
GNMDWKRFHLDAGITYNKNFYTNNIGTGYGVGSFMYNMLIWTGAEYDVRDYRNYWREGKEHYEQNWMDEWWYDNPYFLAYERVNPDHYDVMNSYLTLSYDLTDWLKVFVRLGEDAFRNRSELKQPISSRSNLRGSYSQSINSGYSMTDDAMLMADKRFGDFQVDGFFGGSVYFRENDAQSSETRNGLNLPGFYSLNASIDPVGTSTSVNKQQTNSLYGKVGLSWKSTVFAEVTGRNDWASTLAESERSYFYPSFSGSVILSEFIRLPEAFNFWKVRGSWTQTKSPAGVYDINQNYSVSRNYWGNMTATFYPTSIRDATLKPVSSRAYELGTDFQFFGSRLKLDVAYYHKLVYDLQRSVSLSYASGFESALINYGEQQLSRGVEFTLGGDIIRRKELVWNSRFNWAADRYYYYKVDEQYSTKRPWVADGKDWWWLETRDWERDPEGNIIHYNGLPRTSAYPSLMGSENPDWIWGWSNDIRYRDFRLAFSFDGRVGGRIFNYIEQRLMHSGRLIDTDNQWRYDEVVNGLTNYVGQGVKIVSGSVVYDSDGNITEDSRVFAPNDVPASYETYMRLIGLDESHKPEFIHSKTFFKLRELSLGYTLPQPLCRRIGLQQAEVALVGQNLLLWTKDFRFSDPDRDTESVNAPSMRLIGINLKLNF